MGPKSRDRKARVHACYSVYNSYSDLLDSYVLDYFTAGHWKKLPNTWQKCLENISVESLANILQYKEPNYSEIWPLSLLALQSCLKSLCLSRKMITLAHVPDAVYANDDKLMNLFWKNIKLKKRHEITYMAKICYQKAVETNCYCIVDIGSGLGHLSRLLAFGYGFRVHAIEAQDQLCCQARELDVAFRAVYTRKGYNYEHHKDTIHVNLRIDSNITSEDFLNIVSETTNVKNIASLRFGIVGLHPCGDLGATLLKLYNICPNITFINIAGCCYMKLTSKAENQCYPLSKFCKLNKYNLSYSSLEVACHAIENYTQKLIEGKHWKLKIHAYRALIEKLLVSLRPDLQHSALSNVKYSPGLSFDTYCKKALTKLGLSLPNEMTTSQQVSADLKEWYKIVVFYSIRLSLAPLVETIIILDRLLFAEETGSVCDVLPIFDPKISPRNHVISSSKKC